MPEPARTPMNTSIAQSFGRTVRRLRRQAAASLDDLARQAGLEPDRVAEIEQGRADPALSDIAALARALGKTPAEIMGPSGSDRRADARIEAKLRRLEKAWSCTPDLLAVLDRDLRYVMVNDAYPRHLGIPREKILGARAGLFVMPELFETQTRPRLLSCLAGEKIDWEGWFTHPRSHRPVFCVARLRPWADPVTRDAHVILAIREQTGQQRMVEDLKESEKTTSLLFRVSNVIAGSGETEGIYPIIRRILGEVMPAENFYVALVDRRRDRLDFVYVKSEKDQAFPPMEQISRLTPPLSKENFGDYASTSLLAEVIRTAHPLCVTRAVMRMTGMSCPGAVPEVWLGVPIRVRQEVLGVMAVMKFDSQTRYTKKDMDLMLSVAEQLAYGVDRRRTMADLRAAKEEADRANRAKSDFLAGMSHEIRTPLNAVMGLSDLLLGSRLEREQRDYLETIKDSARHLLTVVGDILDLSKIEARRLELEHIDFDLKDVLRSTVKTFGALAATKGLWLNLDILPSVPRFLKGDPNRLRQIVINLVGNALKFTETGGVTIGVAHAEPATPKRVALSFRVADTGIGLTPRESEAVFDMFRQAETSTARKYGGTGLGLAISRQLVELMGGRIDVASSPGKGSVFTFTALFEPGAPPADLSREPGAGAKPAAPTPDVDPAAVHILLAEDNPVNVKLAGAHLQKLGYRLSVAESGIQALETLARERFDLVLMDVEMPGLDGVSAAEIIRAGGPAAHPVLDPGVPIVAVTAHASPEVRRRCLEAGMDDYMAKPINFDELAAVIRRMLRGGGGARGLDRLAPGKTPAGADACETVLDTKAAMTRLGIDENGYAPILAVSLREIEKRRSLCQAALRDGNMADLALHAHTLKSTMSIIGAEKSAGSARRLEHAADAGSREEAAFFLEVLEREMDEVNRRIQAAQSGTITPNPASPAV
ncbi:response regulator [Desulfolutivibrio sulfoxidireducens]|nr:response regulator [Desulfolutivibrio sulfoxidireducens]